MKTIIKYILILFIPLQGLSQVNPSKEVDSLLQIIEVIPLDRKISNEQALFGRLTKLYDSIEDANQKADVNYQLGYYYLEYLDYNLAIQYFERAFNLYKTNRSWRKYVITSKLLAMSYRGNGDYSKIENVLLKGIEVSKKHFKAVDFYILKPLQELMVHYSYDVNKPKEAIYYGKYFFKELSVFSKKNITNFDFEYSKTIEAAIVHLELGHSYLQLKDYANAKKELEEANTFFCEKNDEEKISRIYNHLYRWAIETNQTAEVIFDYLYEFESNINVFKSRMKAYQGYATEKVAEIEKIKKDLNEKIKENKKLIKQQTKVVVLFSLLLVFAVISILAINKFYRVQKQLNKKIKEEFDALEKLNKERTAFFSVISHELKTPVFAISESINFLTNDSPKETKEETVNIIKASSNHLLNILKNVLAIPLLEKENNEKRIGIKEPFSIIDLLDEIVDRYTFLASQKKIKIELNISNVSRGTIISGEKEKLIQVITNLLINAIKYSPEEEKVTIKISNLGIEEQQIKLKFSIQDRGIGIAENEQKSIFNYKKQINQTISNSTIGMKGLRVGLYVVSRILKQLNSKIELNSKIGEGSTFSFNISYKIIENKEVLDVAETPRKGNILVIDDNRIVLLVTKKMLETLGHTVYVCTDNCDFMSIIKQNNINAVILDINMPIINGYEISRIIKSKSDIEIPIIAHTAAREIRISDIELIDSKIDDVLIKPYTLKDLEAKLSRHLALAKKKNRA